MGRIKGVNLPPFTSPEFLADKFSTFFMKKIANIWNNKNLDFSHDASNIAMNRDLMFIEDMLQKF